MQLAKAENKRPGVSSFAHIPAREIMPGFRGRFIHSAHMTFVLWEIDQGAPLPEHSHLHEQVSHVLEGSFELTVDGKSSLMGPGGIAIIPPHAVHSGKAHTDCLVFDTFYPVREDYKL